MSADSFNVILFGKTGTGKSASGNTILGRECFTSKRGPKAITQEIQRETVSIDGVSLTVYDTPGLFDSQTSNEDNLKKCQHLLCLDRSVSSVFLLVIKADRFTEEQRMVVEKYEKFLGIHFQNTWILFTRGDELENDGLTIEEFIEESTELKRIVQQFEKRYLIFNNKTEDPLQVRKMIKKVQETVAKQAPDLDVTVCHRRLVLLGKSGVGKSAAGNTILGATKFRSEMSSESVTKKCSTETAKVREMIVSVADTPGLFNTNLSHEELATELGRSIYETSPGPHAFLIIISAKERFTKQEEDVIQLIRRLFGEEAAKKYTLILFTHGDQIEGKTVEKFIEENEALTSLVQQCGQRYYIFNNKDKRNRNQVTELLEKIDRMMEENGGRYYTNEMFGEAERLRKEEEKKSQLIGKDSEFDQFIARYRNHLLGAVVGLFVGGIDGVRNAALGGNVMVNAIHGATHGVVQGAMAGGKAENLQDVFLCAGMAALNLPKSSKLPIVMKRSTLDTTQDLKKQ